MKATGNEKNLKHGDFAEVLRQLSELQKREKTHKQLEVSLRQNEQRYRSLVDHANDAMATLDSAGKVVIWNKKAESLYGFTLEEIQDNFFDLATYPPKSHKKNFQAAVSKNCEIFFGPWEGVSRKKTGETFPIEITTSAWKANEKMFFTIVVRDITERKKVEEEQKKLLQNLQQAFNKIKTLSGLVPICTECKKIRDDRGYWNRLEKYIQAHSEAQFSHSICPDCAAELYPEFYGKDK